MPDKRPAKNLQAPINPYRSIKAVCVMMIALFRARLFALATVITVTLFTCVMGAEEKAVPGQDQSATQIEPNLRPTRPLLLAAYYIWYHAADHPRLPWAGWTRKESQNNPAALKARRAGQPPLATPLRPLAGFYDSADPKVVRWHVRLAKAAGIDAFLVSWWGPFKQRNETFEKGILAAAEQLDFKIALLDELAQFHNDFGRYQQRLLDTLRKYKDSRAYLHIDGRPVVYLYQVAQRPGLSPGEFVELKRFVEGKIGPVYWIVDKLAHDPRAARRNDLDRVKCIPRAWLETSGIDAFGFYSTFSHFRAYKYEQLIGKYRYLVELAHGAGKKMLLPVHPGHDNSRFSDKPYVMPRRAGRTLRDYLRAAEDARADFILVTSWNEWPEATVIEPSSSWPEPYRYLKIVAQWKGISFVPPPLPAK